MLIETWRRIQALFARERLDREFDEEAREHLNLATEDYIRRGYSPGEARRMARVRFGAAEVAKDAHRDARGVVWPEGFVYDLRHAVRGLIRDRMFAVASIVILALSVGLNLTTFRIADATLLHGFPLVKQNSQMLFINETYPYPGCCVTYSDFEAWRSQARSFQDLALSVPRNTPRGAGRPGGGFAPRLMRAWIEKVRFFTLDRPGSQDFGSRGQLPASNESSKLIELPHRG